MLYSVAILSAILCYSTNRAPTFFGSALNSHFSEDNSHQKFSSEKSLLLLSCTTMVSIDVKSRSKSLKGLSTDKLSNGSVVSELVSLIANSNRKSIHRIRLTKYDVVSKKNVPLDTSKTFSENGITEEKVELLVKDLGPQISWRTVFVFEYFGPVILYPLFFYVPAIYGYKSIEHTQTQKFAVVMAICHFLKREYETFFVHKFSNATMPFLYLFKNSAHYWLLAGVGTGLFVAGPKFGPDRSILLRALFYVNDLPSWANWSLAGLWTFAEVSNFKTHLILANLRTTDSKKYAIPYGYGFSLLSCPNYYFEILGWVVYSVMVGNWAAWVFTAAGAFQMYIWAIKKHKRYLRTFGDEYKKLKRAPIFPFFY